MIITIGHCTNCNKYYGIKGSIMEYNNEPNHKCEEDK
jgi:hypothetical protein